MIAEEIRGITEGAREMEKYQNSLRENERNKEET